MRNLCADGFQISDMDRKAFEHFVLVSFRKWSEDALAGMINKAKKNVVRAWLPLYREKQTGNISSDYAIIIPAIINMPEFTPFNYKTPPVPVVKRTNPKTEEIWQGGFDVEDYEKMALDAFYENPEEMLRYFMENKIYRRREAFVAQQQTKMFHDPEITEVPGKQDAFINFVCSRPGYKNRAQLEAQMQEDLA